MTPLQPLVEGSNEPGVSFVVTVFNKAPWLEGVCRQIAVQSGDFRREFIFVNDGSTDGSMDVVARCTADWPNLTIHHQENAGSAAATNVGIRLAKYPYVKLVDADDRLHADATALLLHALTGHPLATASFGRGRRVADESEIDLVSPLRQEPGTERPDTLERVIKNNQFNPTQGLIKRADALAVGGCDERCRYSQEYGLELRLALRGPFVAIPHTIVFAPKEVPNRLGANQGRQLQRGNQLLGLFIADHPELPWRLKQLACRRAASRTWKYAHRQRTETWLNSRNFFRQVRSHLPIWSSHAEFIKLCTDAFDELA